MSAMKNQNDMPQAILAEQFGLVYKALYFVEWKDRSYPCNCECHTNPFIMHCVACCDDQSYKKVLMYDGVYKEPEPKQDVTELRRGVAGYDKKPRPSRGNYFLFTDPDPLVQEFRTKYYERKNETGHTMAEMEALYRDGVKIRNSERYVWFNQIGDYTITLHRRAWDKLPKNRHDPVDLPIDFSKVCS